MVAFSPDGRHLLAASSDALVYGWLWRLPGDAAAGPTVEEAEGAAVQGAAAGPSAEAEAGPWPAVEVRRPAAGPGPQPAVRACPQGGQSALLVALRLAHSPLGPPPTPLVLTPTPPNPAPHSHTHTRCAPGAQPVGCLRGHTHDVLAVRFSHEGSRAATCSKDGTARVRGGALLHRPEGCPAGFLLGRERSLG
jgi:WD40 repeat protein